MAKIVENHIMIRVSKLVKDSENENVQLVDPSVLENLETVFKELVDDDTVIIEVQGDK